MRNSIALALLAPEVVQAVRLSSACCEDKAPAAAGASSQGTPRAGGGAAGGPGAGFAAMAGQVAAAVGSGGTFDGYPTTQVLPQKPEGMTKEKWHLHNLVAKMKTAKAFTQRDIPGGAAHALSKGTKGDGPHWLHLAFPAPYPWKREDAAKSAVHESTCGELFKRLSPEDIASWVGILDMTIKVLKAKNGEPNEHHTTKPKHMCPFDMPNDVKRIHTSTNFWTRVCAAEEMDPNIRNDMMRIAMYRWV
ncbi:unnamed protein product [Amoebophrya sp. A25]|nr:unnamed protein product [Amoebophrya sp. A25]|eukprot:GSA25T00009901001.1